MEAKRRFIKSLMVKLRTLGSAAILCGGILILSGCHSQSGTSADGKAFPAPQAAPPVQTQIQQIESDPHIPAAQKAGIEAQIVNNNRSNTPPAKAP